MGDRSGIEWTDATRMVDRGGRRVRTYTRKDASRPGQQLRRRMAGAGFRWCRVCHDWLPSDLVGKSGLCKTHEREDYRSRYAANPQPIRQRVYARRRAIAPVPPEADLVAELFDYRCAYCQREAGTWDHIIPVARGGDSTPGNVVPCCKSCNSSKKASDVFEWLESTGRDPNPYFFEYLFLAWEVA